MKDIKETKNAIINILDKPNTVNIVEFTNYVNAIKKHHQSDKSQESQKFSKELKELTKSLDGAKGLFKNLKIKRAATKFAYDPTKPDSLANPRPKSFIGTVLDTMKEKMSPKSGKDLTYLDSSVATYSYKYIKDKVNEYYPITPEQINKQTPKIDKLQTLSGGELTTLRQKNNPILQQKSTNSSIKPSPTPARQNTNNTQINR